MTMNANRDAAAAVTGNEILRIVTRLKEVQKRFSSEAGSGDRFEHAAERLDAIIVDLAQRVDSAGDADGLDDLELRLAAVEEMIEGLGFPGYAHVIESVRTSLGGATTGGGPDDDDPPVPRRFEPSPRAPTGRRSARTAAAQSDAPVASSGRRLWVWLAVAIVVLVGGLAAALALGLVPLDRWTEAEIVGDELPVGDQLGAPMPWGRPEAGADGNPVPESEAFRETARLLGEIMVEIDAAEAALGDGDVDSALRHLAEAAAIDRHHRGVVGVAESLIDALLEEADAAFDSAQWELASKRVEDARHLADGLYLDSSAIEHTARRHAAMTRFRDAVPVTAEAARAAVGGAVRVTLRSRHELFGILQAIDDGQMVLSIHSGVHGGGVEFDKRVAMADAAELRVYEADRVVDVIR